MEVTIAGRVSMITYTNKINLSNAYISLVQYIVSLPQYDWNKQDGLWILIN